MADDVEAIADRAAKEAHQEAALLVLQNTWDRIEFCVTATLQTGTETPLIKMAEEDLEVLRGWLRLKLVFLTARFTFRSHVGILRPRAYGAFKLRLHRLYSPRCVNVDSFKTLVDIPLPMCVAHTLIRSRQALEADLLIVQSMVASRYTHFKKESLEWQRALSFVGDVMAMLNEIQVC